jgi:hypothetical protein
MAESEDAEVVCFEVRSDDGARQSIPLRWEWRLDRFDTYKYYLGVKFSGLRLHLCGVGRISSEAQES